MGYSPEVLEAAKAALDRRREAAMAEAERRRQRVRALRPRVREIEQEMAGVAIQVARAVLAGGDVGAQVEAIQAENMRLQAEMAAELAAAGERTPNFDPVYTCPRCEDTGFAGGKICACYRQLLQEEACRQVSYSGMGPAGNFGFDTMRLTYYTQQPGEDGVSPRQRMTGIIQYCRQYAEDFGPASPSLLLSGRTGTGKTHVSLAIAHAVTRRGFRVVYGPAQMLLHKLEKEHFGREGGDTLELLTGCDLLVLDDLGAEFGGPFYNACLYNLVNSRMLEGRPTIISTNLGQQAISDRYGEQITSRVIGTYLPLTFLGSDIRQIKLKERME